MSKRNNSNGGSLLAGGVTFNIFMGTDAGSESEPRIAAETIGGAAAEQIKPPLVFNLFLGEPGSSQPDDRGKIGFGGNLAGEPGSSQPDDDGKVGFGGNLS